MNSNPANNTDDNEMVFAFISGTSSGVRKHQFPIISVGKRGRVSFFNIDIDNTKRYKIEASRSLKKIQLTVNNNGIILHPNTKRAGKYIADCKKFAVALQERGIEFPAQYKFNIDTMTGELIPKHGEA